MPADRRLTIETVRPGMKVRCVDATHGSCDAGQLREGEIYTVKGPRGDTGDIWLEGVYSSWEPSRFIPADPEPAPSWATEELRKALIAWKHVWDTSTFPDETADYGLNDAIEASGLLPRAPASTTERAATLDDGWWA